MTGSARIRVLIAEDHPDLREALAMLIEREDDFELAAAAIDAADAIELAEREQPDVALLDVQMPGGGGLAAARGIAACSPHTRIMMLSAYGPPTEPLGPGVVGHVAKGRPNADIIDSVRRAASHQPLS